MSDTDWTDSPITSEPPPLPRGTLYRVLAERALAIEALREAFEHLGGMREDEGDEASLLETSLAWHTLRHALERLGVESP